MGEKLEEIIVCVFLHLYHEFPPIFVELKVIESIRTKDLVEKAQQALNVENKKYWNFWSYRKK